MTINASPATVRAVTKAFQLAGILDDRCAQPDKARIAAWAEQVERHKLTEPDLLDGLQAFYDSPSERAIQIGDLIHHARIIRRDRNEREEAAEQAARLKVHDQQAVDGISGVAAVMGPVKNRTPRLVKAELALQCASGKREVLAAMSEWTAAKLEAKGNPAAHQGRIKDATKAREATE
ncbi:hypothetical protein [Mycobacterium kansasii]|uniref:hypothetical protein n=1 Tax=Mycobacterium kansasii TaxID=1768 RepID=UPI0009EF790A|nr:hypothetical protein [Mycobacterium kansasii]ARG91422.1 hypothetical protein B1T50_04730 [Mycobacterium kansasii]